MIREYFAWMPTEVAVATVIIFGIVALLALFCGVMLLPQIARDSLEWCREAFGQAPAPIPFDERRRELLLKGLADGRRMQ